MTQNITQPKPWFVYLLRTAQGSLYTGISTDPERRLREHEGSARGARSLRGKGPLELVWRCAAADRSSASALEARIKRLSRARKLELIKHGTLL
ncbi:MAG: GIY-YIG nuclease family protein [Pseudomonadales bacterium]|nr:GIY-YIG nuclease family protein [Pseudomonadales bacterium]